MVVRILPPMKSLADSGEWAIYAGTHFGYKGVNPKDRSKPTYRTFKCIQERDFKTKMVLQDCPECDLINARDEELKALEADAKAKGHSEDEVKELSAPLKTWLSDHNCDRKWHMNVKMQDGSFAILQISHKTKKLLEAEIARVLTEDGIEALELDQGVWFRFNRTGKGVETQDTVSVEYESVRDNGRVIRTVKLAPLTEAECEKALKECPDLTTTVRSISYEQIKLLTQCSGDDEDVDAILAMGQKKEASPQATQPMRERPSSTPAAPKVQTQAAAPAPASQAAQPAPVAGGEADIQAQIAALQAQLLAKSAAPQQATPAQETAPAAPVQSAPVAPTPAASPASGLPVDRAAFMARFNKPGTPKAA